MKLRIKGQSLRLRLTHEEVRQLAASGRLEEQLWLAADRALTYRIAVTPEAQGVGVRFADDVIEVQLPSPAARQWCEGEEVTLSGSQSLGARALRIMVEKEFDERD